MSTAKLTKTVLEGLPLPLNGEQVHVYDSALRGFGVRLSAGTRSFFVERRVNGRTRRATLGRYPELTVAQAREAAQVMLGKMALGVDPTAARRADRVRSVSLAEAFEGYLSAHSKLAPRTRYDYQRAMAVAYGDWGARPWTEVTGSMVARRHGELSKARGPAYANLCGRVLRTVLNFAIASYRGADDAPLVLENPVARLTQGSLWNPVGRRTSYIKPSALPAWFDAVRALPSETVKDYLLLLMFTGLRRAEAARLRWDNVDLHDRSFVVTDTKNGDPLRLPMSDFLFELFKRRKERAAGHYVFPSQSGQGHLTEPKKSMQRVSDVSGVQFTVHDVRRTFITIAESLDIPTYSLKALLNHRANGGDVTGGYIQIATERLRGPVQMIAKSILAHAGHGPTAKVVPFAVQCN